MKQSNQMEVDRKVFLDLCAAAESARAWMAHNAPANSWANGVRENLNNALQAAIQEKGEPVGKS